MKQSLFRSIRRKLLLRPEAGYAGHVLSKKLVRYLTYALGEILLIVVGIMLALQLNNWNEDRKAQAKFGLYIGQLREDVSLAMELLEREIEEAESKKDSGVFLLKKLKGEAINADEISKFEKDLDSLGRIELVDLNIGYLKGLLEGNVESMVHDRSLTLSTMQTIRAINKNLLIAKDKVRIMQQVDATIMRYRGRRIFGVPELQMSYDLDQLRSSREFLYALENATEAVDKYGNTLSSGRQTLEDYLAVLEEYE